MNTKDFTNFEQRDLVTSKRTDGLFRITIFLY